MVQIITREFPDPTRANCRITDPRYPTGVILVPVPEIERRHKHLSLISDTHSMVGLIRDCLKDEEKDRPTTQQLCQQLSTLKGAAQYSESRQEEEDGRREEGVRERVREVEGKERGVRGRLEEVEGREREVERRESEVRERLQAKDQELQREREAKERLSRRLEMTNVQVQQMHERHRQMENQLRDEIKQIREEKDQLLRDKYHETCMKDRIIHELQLLSVAVVYTYQVSGPGLRSATVNYSTHITVVLRDHNGQPCLVPQKITAQLEEIDALVQQSFWFRKNQKKILENLPVDIAADFPSHYNVSFTAVTRGQHKLHIQHNGSEINGSPFTITVYPDPTRLGTPVRVMTGLKRPRGIAINSHGEIIGVSGVLIE